MNQSIGHVAYLVRDYDEAISFFIDKLGFDLIEDTPRGNGKRRVLVRPRGSNGTSRLLAKAVTTEQVESIGKQAAGSFSSYTQMISNTTTTSCVHKALNSLKSRVMKSTVL